MAQARRAFPPLDCGAYTVGWITVLNVEFAAAIAVLDEKHTKPETAQDPYLYVTGRIGQHNVVITCSSEAGPSSANHCATQLTRTFPNIQIGLLCGIGGAVPSDENDIRLGDVVVSKPGKGYGGVVWYDPGKLTDTGFKSTGHLNQPPLILRSAVEYLEALKILRQDHKFKQILAEAEATGFASKAGLRDELYDADDLTKKVARASRSLESAPEIHYGTIASGSWVIKTSGSKRNALLQQIDADVLCFEMEAAGLMNNFPCLVVRGMSDYCDSHKNDDWHSYAAMTAACYCKWLLHIIQSSRMSRSQPAAGSIEITRLHSFRNFISQRPICCARIVANTTSRKRFAPFVVHVSQEKKSWADTRQDIQSWQRLISRISDYNHNKTQRRLQSIRLPGTVDWFFNHDSFQNWKSSSEITSLWCSGSLGSGKTIISSAVIEHFQKSAERIKAPVFFFFFDASYSRTADKIYAFRSLLKQQLEYIIETNPSDLVATERKIEYFFNPNGPQPDWQDIADIFTGLFKRVSRAYYIIDGLHEVVEEDIRQIMNLFQDLLRKRTTQKIFISSREELGWNVKLSTDLQIRITFVDTKGDLWKYIETEITSTTNSRRQLTTNPEVKNQIMQSLFRDAYGMFLWVRLQIEGLRQDCTSDREILKALNDLPLDLELTYKRCLERIPKVIAHLTPKVLRWVCFSFRPLHIDELAEAVSFSFSDCKWDPTGVHSNHAIIGSCANLVVLSEDDGCLRLVHPSVKKYLANWDGQCSPKMFPNVEQEDTKCGEECINYLSFDDFKLQLQQLHRLNIEAPNPSTLTPNTPFGNLTRTLSVKLFPRTAARPLTLQLRKPVQKPSEIEKYKFLQYATDYWAFHTKHISETSIVWSQFSALALQQNISWKIHPWTASGQSMDSHLHGLLVYASREDHIPLLKLIFDPSLDSQLKEFCNIPSMEKDGLTALQIAARLGHTNVITLLLSVCDVNYEGRGSQPALFYAIEKNQYVAAEIILSKRDVNMKKRSASGITAFEAALHHGFADMAELILSLDPSQAKSRKELQNEFFTAVASGHEAVAGMLIQRFSVDFNSKSLSSTNRGWTPFDIALRNGQETVIKLLLEQPGINLRECETPPLFRAIRLGHESIVQMLIKRTDVDINLNFSGQTALGIAIQNDRDTIMRLLLQHPKININQGRQPILFQAVYRGRESVAKVLLQQSRFFLNANFDLGGETALSIAITRGYEEVAILILQDPRLYTNFELKDGKTVIHHAATGGNEAIMKALLKNPRVNINFKDKLGQTALHKAVLLGHTPVTKVLIQHPKLDVNSKTNNEWTALHHAAERGNYEAAKVLLQHPRIDTNSKCEGNGSALHIAAAIGSGSVIQVLLQHPGINIDLLDVYGRTALQVAVLKGHNHIQQLLAEQGMMHP